MSPDEDVALFRRRWIQNRAFALWLQAGRPEGCSDLYWYMAERQYMATVQPELWAQAMEQMGLSATGVENITIELTTRYRKPRTQRWNWKRDGF
jgi:hypothetical protein